MCIRDSINTYYVIAVLLEMIKKVENSQYGSGEVKTILSRFKNLLNVYQGGKRETILEFCRELEPTLSKQLTSQVIDSLLVIGQLFKRVQRKDMSEWRESPEKSTKKELSAAQLQERRDILDRLREGKCTVSDLFRATDMEFNGNGSISKDEFILLAKRMHITLSSHRVDEIFATVKNMGSNKVSDELDEQEFILAFSYIRQKMMKDSIIFLGISKGTLFAFLVLLSLCLVLLLAFLLAGISVFTKPGSSFGSVINSCIVTRKLDFNRFSVNYLTQSVLPMYLSLIHI
eukprot:TRINITY_DN8926_c0_g2_i10.p1 TRINITY_DN8926_c0_g2~~TRINITY_DN8926_c0_g2_i10.p1  ORF type:complete len:308 (+),score=55.58 TRINITY_DN8926_c0_g2_i10:61-924(+)